MQIRDSITDQEISHFSPFKICMYFIHILSKDKAIILKTTYISKSGIGFLLLLV